MPRKELIQLYHENSDPEYLACAFCVPIEQVKKRILELNESLWKPSLTVPSDELDVTESVLKMEKN